MDNPSSAPATITSSGVGVIDRTIRILDALELGPQGLADLVAITNIPRPTVHRLAGALETHRLVERDAAGRYRIGPRTSELGQARTQDPVSAVARGILAELRDRTGESAQLFRRIGDNRVCVAVADRTSGLRDTVPLGSVLPLTAGSAAQVLLAWEPAAAVADLLAEAAFSDRTLTEVRDRGWAQSVAEREAGVASVSVPVRGRGDRVIAAMSVSGPAQRLAAAGGRDHVADLLAAADSLTAQLSGRQQTSGPGDGETVAH